MPVSLAKIAAEIINGSRSRKTQTYHEHRAVRAGRGKAVQVHAARETASWG